MKMKVLLFGASGNLGRKITAELLKNHYDTTVVLRKKSQHEIFSDPNIKIITANPLNRKEIENICQGFDVVISALGKSVSMKDNSKNTFQQVDYEGNMNILEEAKKARIQKFIYVSAYKAEDNIQLKYFKVHHDFSEQLKLSGLNYCIIKPPAIFSAYAELVDIAKTGFLPSIGSGNYKTNPIYEGDLARAIVAEITRNNNYLEIGGKYIYSRKQLLEIIKTHTNPNAGIQVIPIKIMKVILPFFWIINRNLYHKMAFINKVMQEDLIAPMVGEMSFEEYIQGIIKV